MPAPGRVPRPDFDGLRVRRLQAHAVHRGGPSQPVVGLRREQARGGSRRVERALRARRAQLLALRACGLELHRSHPDAGGSRAGHALRRQRPDRAPHGGHRPRGGDPRPDRGRGDRDLSFRQPRRGHLVRFRARDPGPGGAQQCRRRADGLRESRPPRAAPGLFRPGHLAIREGDRSPGAPLPRRPRRIPHPPRENPGLTYPLSPWEREGVRGKPKPDMDFSATLSPAAWRRKAVHAGMGILVLTLRWLDWKAAAVIALAALLFNLFVLPRFGRGIYRDSGAKRDTGIVSYAAMVLVLIVLFRGRYLPIAAAVWAMMAFGDPAAAIAGRLVG